MSRLLLVEDDDGIAEPLAAMLTREGHEVERVGDGATALERSRQPGVDLVILDIGLPRLDGLTVCRTLRAEGVAVPIMLLTARAGELDAVVGLDAGADDYVAKPIRVAELIARVRALLRRGGQGADAAPTSDPGGPTPDGGPGAPGSVEPTVVRVDEGARRAWTGPTELALTRKEFDLLALLARHRGEVVTRDRIMTEVWDTDWYTSTKTLDMHVAAIRQKLADGGGDPAAITTVRGVGFRLEPEP